MTPKRSTRRRNGAGRETRCHPMIDTLQHSPSLQSAGTGGSVGEEQRHWTAPEERLGRATKDELPETSMDKGTHDHQIGAGFDGAPSQRLSDVAMVGLDLDDLDAEAMTCQMARSLGAWHTVR